MINTEFWRLYYAVRKRRSACHSTDSAAVNCSPLPTAPSRETGLIIGRRTIRSHRDGSRRNRPESESGQDTGDVLLCNSGRGGNTLTMLDRAPLASAARAAAKCVSSIQRVPATQCMSIMVHFLIAAEFILEFRFIVLANRVV